MADFVKNPLEEKIADLNESIADKESKIKALDIAKDNYIIRRRK